MHTLIFATNNRNKVAEIQSLVGPNFTIIPLKEAGIDIDSDWKVYRQELRDMPADSSWPSIGVWPQLGPKESSDDI